MNFSFFCADLLIFEINGIELKYIHKFSSYLNGVLMRHHIVGIQVSENSHNFQDYPLKSNVEVWHKSARNHSVTSKVWSIRYQRSLQQRVRSESYAS